MTDFQRRSSVQGRSFEEAVATFLQIAGWTIVGLHVMVEGAEIDIVAVEPLTGVEWWIECKGSWYGKVPGSKRGDTVKKAVGVAAYLATVPDRKPYRLITSHLPNDGTLSARMLRVAQEQGWFSAIDTMGFLGYGTEEDVE